MAESRGVAAAAARNALSGGGRFAVSASVALVVTPYALHSLGAELFGLWALAGALLSTLLVFDLGLNRSVVRAVAAASGKGDRGVAAPVLATSRGIALCLGVLAIVVVWLAIDAVVNRLLGLPAAVQPLARQVLVGTTVVAAIEGAFAPFRSALDGTGRMDVSNSIDTVQRVASGAGTVVVLALGWGLVGLVGKNAATALLAGIAYRRALRRRAPGLLVTGPRLDAGIARDMLSFGRHVQAVALSALAMDVGAKVLLGRGPGLDAVALYELAARVVTQVGGALLAAAMALFPAAAEVHAAAGERATEQLQKAYRRGTRYLAWLAFPAFAFVIALAGPFTTAWLGTGYAKVHWSMAVLAAGWLMATIGIPAHLVAQAGGQPRLSVLGAVVTATVAMLTGAALVAPYGLAGIVVGLAAGLVVGVLVTWRLFAVAFGTGWSTVTTIGWRAPAAALLGAGSASWLLRVLPELRPDSAASIAAIVCACAVGSVVFVVSLVVLGEAKPNDWALLRQAVSVPMPRWPRPPRENG